MSQTASDLLVSSDVVPREGTVRITCRRCIYTDDVPGITFDAEGVCRYCAQMDGLAREYPNGPEGERILEKIFAEIRKAGRGKRYDCVVGVSGGCDSSWLLYQVVERGLRPLAVHFDNTWNTAEATDNIHRVTRGLNVDLHTYVVDNKEIDDIFRSFLLAGVPEIDVATDMALVTTQYRAAAKHGVHYQMIGASFRTEGVVPLGWTYMDGKYIESVHKQFGTRPLRTFPNLWLQTFMRHMLLSRVRRLRPLYYLDYNKEEAKRILSEKFGWTWYGGHHLENRWSRFHHTFYKPVRVGVDHRANGYAALVRSGQMTREEGLALMSRPAPIDEDLIEYVKQRLGFDDVSWNAMMTAPQRTYRDFKTYKKVFERLRPFFWCMYKLDLVEKAFYMKYTKRHPRP